jgi:glycosyltransferase involved in cell wall biosynthesis
MALARLPARIDQVIPSIVERDAVSYHALEVQALLQDLGFASAIFSDYPSGGLASRVKPLKQVAWHSTKDTWICYQSSIGSPSADLFATLAGVKILNYHNITPPELVEFCMPGLAEEARWGRRQLADLATAVSLGIGVSEFNVRELDKLGYFPTAYARLMMDPRHLLSPPNAQLELQLMERREPGGADWLYVGQMLPHKAQHHVVEAFAKYRQLYDSKARLYLVGPLSCSAYEKEVRKLVADLGLADSVSITGSVSTDDLVAFYRCCDIFVGCSDHEGFGAPFIEAMHHGMPVVAYGAAAVRNTVGGAGIVLDSKDADTIAAAVSGVLADQQILLRVTQQGQERAREFDIQRARSEFTAALSLLMESSAWDTRVSGTHKSSHVERVTSRPPVRIDQITPSIVDRDAVSFHYLEAQRVFRELGFVSEIYSVMMGPEMAGRAHPVTDLPRDSPDRQWICYQSSIGSVGADIFASHPGVRLLNYHNITPAPLVEKWMPSLAAELRLGRHQLRRLAPLVALAVADSPYNMAELQECRYGRTAVSMLMTGRRNVDASPDLTLLNSMVALRTDVGGADWLYVGHLLPHKAQHDLIMAFAAYREAYDSCARLHLVGREACPPYVQALKHLVQQLQLQQAINFEGSVSSEHLAALYEGCNVFVGCSDHEGFCAPLVEAMTHGLPIVAYGAGAVGDTVGDAGIIIPDKQPATVAAAVHVLLRDLGLQERLQHVGLERSASFAPEIARQQFKRTIERALDELLSRT